MNKITDSDFEAVLDKHGFKVKKGSGKFRFGYDLWLCFKREELQAVAAAVRAANAKSRSDWEYMKEGLDHVRNIRGGK